MERHRVRDLHLPAPGHATAARVHVQANVPGLEQSRLIVASGT